VAPAVQQCGAMSHKVIHLIAAVVITLFAAVPAALAAPSDDRILPVEQYSSEKARTLALKYAPALRTLNATIYHCMPWTEVQKQSIGFYKPKYLPAGDDRYLSVRLYVEQDASPQFSALRFDERASSMFSRYVGPMLQRMTTNASMLRDPSLDGFTVILEWLKQTPTEGGRPIHETIAVFLDRPAVADYLTGSHRAGDLAGKARVFGWDGETPLGQQRLMAWDDNFVSTYKVKNYQLEPGVNCP
jgi:hypothetical protein